jgi:hypothetical protein
MGTPVMEAKPYVNVNSASVAVSANKAHVLGFFCSTSVSGTLDIRESAAGTVVVPQFQPIAGQWYPLPFSTVQGLYLTVGGTLTGALAWEPAV